MGGAINIQIISLIAATHSWRASYGYVGLFMMAMTVPVFLIMRRTPEEIGMLPDGDRPAPGSDTAPQSGGGRRAGRRAQAGTQEFSWTAREAMKTRAYWCIAGTAVLAIIASAGLGYILVPFLVSDTGPGLSNPQAVGVGALGAVLAMTTLVWGFPPLRRTGSDLGRAWWRPFPGRCFPARSWPPACTRCGRPICLPFCGGSSPTPWERWSTCCWLNTSGGGPSGRYWDRLGPLQTTALGAAPVFGSYLLTFTHSYSVVFIVLMAMYAGAGMLILLAKAPRLPPRANQAQAEPGVAPATV